MLLLSTKNLKAGMTLARAVLHPGCEDCVLLTEGVNLTTRYIERLAQLGVAYAWIAVPGFEEVDERVSEPISRDHMRLFAALNSSVNRLEQRVEVKVNMYRYRKAVRAMLTSIVSEPHHDAITHQLAGCGSVLMGHMSNTAYLSLLIGAHMSGYLRNERAKLPADVAENTSELGVGALLHDIGKLQMPAELQCKNILDDEAAWPEYKCHVRAGYEQARDHLSVLAANTILNHHQRYDGRGFPERKGIRPGQPAAPLVGRQIHIFSRIVSVTDAFDHMLCPHGKITPTVIATHQLRRQQMSGAYDPVVVEALLRLVPPFQLGSTVTLTDGKQAVVIANNPEAPCRPVVRLMSEGPTGNPRALNQMLDLRMSRNCTIAAVDGEDVRPYIFTGDLEPV